MAKKSFPGPIKLTLKTARELAKRELGTAKGLVQEASTMKGWYCMTVGNLMVRIHPQGDSENGHIVMAAGWASGMKESIQLFDPETLEKDFAAEDRQHQQEKKAQFEDWVGDHGVDYCCQKVKEAWGKQG